MNKFFNSYKGRQISPFQRVEVYRNLKFKDRVVYSIRDPKTKLVLGHASDLLLSRCRFIVNEAGRQRVLKERKKNVHAWIQGSYGVIHAGDDRIFSKGKQVHYNPYNGSKFEMWGGEEIEEANLVYIQGPNVIASGL